MSSNCSRYSIVNRQIVQDFEHFEVSLLDAVGAAFLVRCRQICGDLGSDYQITSQQGSPQEMQISISDRCSIHLSVVVYCWVFVSFAT